MPYILVDDFRGGLDTRRLDVTANPGTLVTLKNAHITRGGEIEKRQAFVSLATLPTNTFGLAAAGGQIYVFGSDAASSVNFAAGTPSNINYVRLQHPSGNALTKVLSVDFFDGRVYAAAEFSDGRIFHYYDGVRITDWFDGRARAKIQITAGTQGGTAATGSFTVSAGTANPGDDIRVVRVNGVEINDSASPIAHTGNNATTATNVANAINNFTSSPNYSASANNDVVTITAVDVGIGSNGFVVAVTTQGGFGVSSINNMSGGVDNAITDITVNGVSILQSQVKWATSNTATATALAAAINDFTSAPNFEATAFNDFVNIIADDPGATPNNQAVVVSVAGNVTTVFSPTSQNFMDGGATSNAINGYTPGGFVRPVKNKMYALSDSLLHFSAVSQPDEWNDGSLGAGFINLANNATGSEDLKAIANYFDNIAVFAEQAVQIWFVDADEDLNQQIQVVVNTGTIAPNSVVEFGDNDVFYLSLSGIRSLRARDSSNAAFVGDIGNPIDELLAAEITSNRLACERSQAILEPRDGRYFLAIGSQIFVFSYFPSSRVSAWSLYEPGFTVDNWAYDGKQILCRAGDSLFSLGGADGNTYDSSAVEVQMPFLDAGQAATFKDFHGLDVTCQNQWDISVATDPQDITTLEPVATVHRTTYGLGRVTMTGYSTHIAPKLSCSQPGPAKIGNIAIHYNATEAG
tara:strand:- start:2058 stop:4136 length:2079 start_codon:yes stop_codon:yes gene_type:complete